MCGILALLGSKPPKVPVAALQRMVDAVAHRGPDGRGLVLLAADGSEVRVDGARSEWRVALGHRRLSILDLSAAGAQPMARGARLWATYNGEIYNYVELRRELSSSAAFSTETDTEVLLAAYEAWGTDCFRRLRGMWGLVLIDLGRRVAVVSRDRLGIKPVYLAPFSGGWAVVSEVKQLLELPGYALRPERASVETYLKTGYEMTGRSFFEGVRPLPPGTFVEIDLDTGIATSPRSFWSPEEIEVSVTSRREAAERFRSAFEESVSIHLRSDVPVGCALSGGLDSSAVAAMCSQRLSSGRLKAFSVVFPGEPIDETPFVDAVVRRTGAESFRVSPRAIDLVADLERFVYVHDEPVGSAAQYAGYALARVMRAEGVPVTLNGQGGDEVFAGYWQSYLSWLFGQARAGHVVGVLGHLLLAGADPRGNADLLLQVPTMMRRLGLRRGAATHRDEDLAGRVLGMTARQRRVFEIREMYLPRLLKWDDRNFMAFSVEGRYPFLDHRVIETVLSFEPSLLYRAGWVKEPLRAAMQDALPDRVVRRTSKLGFETPQQRWLREDLRPVLESTLDGDSPVWEVLDREQARRAFAREQAGASAGEELSQFMFRTWMVDRWMQRFSLSWSERPVALEAAA